MNFTITALLQKVDQFGSNYVSQAFQNLSSALTGGGQVGVAGLLLTLYVIFWAWTIWQGTANGGPTEQVWRLLRAFAIYTLATSWVDFEILVYRALNEGPSAVGDALLTSTAAATSGGGNLSSSNGVQTALQNIWDSIAGSTMSFIKNLGVLNFGGYILGAVILVAGAALVGYALFLIILAKIFLWLLLSLAPIFIILLLFGVTSRFFSGWMSSLVQYVCVQILVYAFCAFFISITKTYFDAVNASLNASTTTLTEAAPLILICILGVLLLSQITSVAASIAGGVSMGVPTFRRFMRPVSSTAGSGSRMLFNKGIDKLGMTTPAERSAGRAHARTRLAQRRYENSAAYKKLADKLTDTA